MFDLRLQNFKFGKKTYKCVYLSLKLIPKSSYIRRKNHCSRFLLRSVVDWHRAASSVIVKRISDNFNFESRKANNHTSSSPKIKL